MKDYHANAIRNVAILGHLGSGKTSLSEALLYVGGAIEKKGEVERKNTVDPDVFQAADYKILLKDVKSNA